MIHLTESDLSLVEKYRPRTLGDILGQPKVVKFLAAYCKRPTSKAFILHGPSGTGKTSAAMALARDLGVVVEDGPFGGFWEVKAGEQSIDSLRDLMRKIPVTHGFGCVGSGHKLILVEEADRCSKEVATYWLGAIEEIKRNVPRCTVVFTTNHPGKIDARLMSRFSQVAFNGSRADLLADVETLITRLWVAETGRTDAPPELNEFPEITINDSDDINIRAIVEQFEDYLIMNEIGRKQVDGLQLIAEPVAAPSLFGYVGQFATKSFPVAEVPTIDVVAEVVAEVTTPSSGFSETRHAEPIAEVEPVAEPVKIKKSRKPRKPKVVAEVPAVDVVAEVVASSQERDYIRGTCYDGLGYCRITDDDFGTSWRILHHQTDSTIGPVYLTKGELLDDLKRFASDFGCHVEPAAAEVPTIDVVVEPVAEQVDSTTTITLNVSRDDYAGTAQDVATIGVVDVETLTVDPARVESVETTASAKVETVDIPRTGFSEPLASRIWGNERTQVKTPDGVQFTIAKKEDFGAKWFGVIPDGKSQAVRDIGHIAMSREQVENWACDLAEVRQAETKEPIPTRAQPPAAVLRTTQGKKPRNGSLASIMSGLDRNERLADHAKKNTGTQIHPFTLAGLGTAPFRHLESYDLGQIDSYCDCCGTPIRYVATIQSSEGKTSKIGHICLDRHASGPRPAAAVAC